MSDGKNIRITNETFVKLENIKSDARSNGKRLSLGAIVDDLVSFRDKLPYASCGKAFGEVRNQERKHPARNRQPGRLIHGC